MEKICIIGLGGVGPALVTAFCEAGIPVSVLDTNQGRIEALDAPEDRVCLSNLSHDSLKKAHLAECEQVIVCLEDRFLLSEEVILAASVMGISKITAFAKSESRANLLKSIGAHEVSLTGTAASARSMVVVASSPCISSFAYFDANQGVGELPVARTVAFDVRAIESEYNVRWIGVYRANETSMDSLESANTTGSDWTVEVEAGDSVVFFGMPSVLEALSGEYFS